MLKINLSLVVLITLLACNQATTIEQKIQTSLDQYFKKNINDTEGYEFVAIEDLDTITNNDFRRTEITILSVALDKYTPYNALSDLENTSNELLALDPDNLNAKESIQMVFNKREELRLDSIERDSFKTALIFQDSNEINRFDLIYKFRAINEKGSKELSKYYVQLNPDMTVRGTSKQKLE